MTSSSPPPTRRLEVAPEQLDLEPTLDCGQAFRWRRDEQGAWIGVVGHRVFRLWREGDLRFRCWPDDPTAVDEIASYFRLEVDLAELRRIEDAPLAEALLVLPGLRVLGQSPRETLLTFVCTPASNIVRITRSIDLLARLYGEPIATVEGRSYHAFPEPHRLARTEPGELAATTGLGFRGRYLRDVSTEILARPEDWVDRLLALPYREARAGLIGLPSVGPKIADCVSLFGLRKDEAVPVDTHVWALARALFPHEVRARTLTPAAYESVLDAFRARYGRWAGWAQQYLFHARRTARELPMPSAVRLIGA